MSWCFQEIYSAISEVTSGYKVSGGRNGAMNNIGEDIPEEYTIKGQRKKENKTTYYIDDDRVVKPN